MAIRYNKMYQSREKISDVLSDPKADYSIKKKLELLNKILLFAKNERLNVEGAYQDIIFNEGGAVSYVMQAANTDSLDQVTWWYPFVGRVPYKGYFTKQEAQKAVMAWQNKNYDTYLGSVSAFSSLGWFEDPVFSSMLNRREFDLAELIFHELVHRTIWIAGSVELNEQLATYVAEKLTIEYLLSEKKEIMLNNYQAVKQDKQLFSEWLSRLKKELSQYYSLSKDESLEKTLSGKQQIFKKYLSLLRPGFKKTDYIGSDISWNNAKVLSFSLYSPNYELFDKAYVCFKDRKVGDFLVAVKAFLNGEQTHLPRLDKLCEESCE